MVAVGDSIYGLSRKGESNRKSIDSKMELELGYYNWDNCMAHPYTLNPKVRLYSLSPPDPPINGL